MKTVLHNLFILLLRDEGVSGDFSRALRIPYDSDGPGGKKREALVLQTGAYIIPVY